MMVPSLGNCAIAVVFTPTSLGAVSTSFTVNGNPGGPRTVTVTGTGI
jgi:hypothetical protein